MAQVVVRDIAPDVYEKLKARAKQNSRSLEAELRILFQAAVEEPVTYQNDEIIKVRALFAGRRFSDSVELLREDRDR